MEANTDWEDNEPPRNVLEEFLVDDGTLDAARHEYEQQQRTQEDLNERLEDALFHEKWAGARQALREGAQVNRKGRHLLKAAVSRQSQSAVIFLLAVEELDIDLIVARTKEPP